jgi:transmembrane sensor
LKNHSEHIDELIAKLLSGEITPEENSVLENWKAESPENYLYFEKTRELFQQIESLKTEKEVDINKAWKNLEQKLDEEEAKVIPLKPVFTMYHAAAAVAVVAFLTILIVFFIGGNKTETLAFSSDKNHGTTKLPDGSSVVLRKNSEIVYEAGSHKREVKLKGEAYFDVVHNEEQPFVVTVNGITIQDIGTSFNVKATEGSNIIEVIVESGEVHFFSSEDKGLKLVKGEKAVYSMKDKKFSKAFISPDDNTTSYHSKVFHFKETPLSSVIEQLNDVYEMNIGLENTELRNCLLSVTFNNEKPEAILNIIAETLNLEVVRTGNSITLRGEPCNN